MNSKITVSNEKDKELNYDLLKLDLIDTSEYDEEKEIEAEEENAITELNDVAILSNSKISLKIRTKETVDAKKGGFRARITMAWERLPLKGFILSVIYACLNSLVPIITKLTPNLAATDLGFIRYFIQLLIMMTIIKCKNFNPLGPKKQRRLLIVRALVGTCGLVTLLFGYKMLHPSDCLAIFHSSVVITSILARIFLKEKLSIAHLVALVLTSAGILLIAKPKSLFQRKGTSVINPNVVPFNETFNCSNETAILNCTTASDINLDNSQLLDNYKPALYTALGVLFALIAAFASSSVQVMLKKLSTQKVHFSIVIASVTYAGIPVTFTISLIFIITGFAHKNFSSSLTTLPYEILYGAISGIIGALSQMFLNFSLKYEEASKVAIIRSLDVFFSFFIQYLVLNIKVDVFSLIGSCAILLGTSLILLFKLIENKMQAKSNSKSFNATEAENKNYNCFPRLIKLKF